jgi:carbonic anhydrase
MRKIKSASSIILTSMIVFACGHIHVKTDEIADAKKAQDNTSMAKNNHVDSISHPVGMTSANSAEEILQSLQSGNARFVKQLSDAENPHSSYNFSEQLAHTKTEQHPIAFVLTCIDSRVPPEIIFDQGIGGIFVGRVAGNIEDAAILGSMEYAVAVKKVKLVIVMGHTNCGAISAAFGKVDPSDEELVLLVKHVAHNVVPNDKPPYDASAIHNVKITMEEILKYSKLIRAKVDSNQVKIVGGLYNVADGKVNWDLQ